jgi:hypothetical protein
MRTKIAYAVFTFTPSGLDYMVKGNFGDNKDAADTWAKEHLGDVNEHVIVNGPLAGITRDIRKMGKYSSENSDKRDSKKWMKKKWSKRVRGYFKS